MSRLVNVTVKDATLAADPEVIAYCNEVVRLLEERIEEKWIELLAFGSTVWSD